MSSKLFRINYRSFGQLSLFEGKERGPTEQLIPIETLRTARTKAFALPRRIHTYHPPYAETGETHFGKEVIVLHKDVCIVIPTVRSDLEGLLDVYDREGLPGLSLQAATYEPLPEVARELGLQIPAESEELVAGPFTNRTP